MISEAFSTSNFRDFVVKPAVKLTASQISISAKLGMSFGGCFLRLAFSTIRIETDL